jgi:Cu/Ag efflux pump CusA
MSLTIKLQVITTSQNLSTQDIEHITLSHRSEIANLVKEIRSISKFGLSVVTIVLKMI